MAEAGDRAIAAASQLEKIGFVEFTTHLVRDVYSTIVEACLDQLKAYADFVDKVAKTLDEYMDEVLGDDAEKTRKVDEYIKEVLEFQFDSSTTDLILTDEQVASLQQHFLGVTHNNKSIDDSSIITGDPGSKKIKLDDLRAFVLEKIKKNATESYNLIKSILRIGMQKVVVTNGDIHTKLTFHVDATDTYEKKASDYSRKSSSWGVRGSLLGRLGGIGGAIAGVSFGNFIGLGVSGGYGSRKLNVSIINEKSTAATNVTIDILGSVRILFRTETFPSIEG